ncbi:MAG: purine-binding chemotaxis protein CheW [Methanomicrobiaceae archaeon]|nr:purine-binding chemotaxis protein CheW [Methanomicrobiaceae archaeon]
MSTTFDLVEFELSGERYALDIYLAREIVEMMPITPIPRAPSYISGIMNLRGEITSIISLNYLLSLPPDDDLENRKIIVLTTETAGGSNVGIIVDDVHSVIQVSEDDVEHVGEGISSDVSNFVKGIIKVGCDDAEKKQGLVIWIDMLHLLKDLENRAS